MPVNLDSRVVRIARWLLLQSSTRSTADLASDLGLSQRVVRYRLDVVDRWLASQGATLERQRGSGLYVVASDELKTSLLADLSETNESLRVNTPDERQHLLLAALLWAAPETTSLDQLHKGTQVSKPSTRRDLQICEPWLERNDLPLVRRPGKGIAIVGPESRVRQAIVQFILETIPSEVLHEAVNGPALAVSLADIRIPAGLRDRLLELPLREAAHMVRSSGIAARVTAPSNELIIALHVAVAVTRLRQGKQVVLATGVQRSLLEHPVGQSAAELTEAMSELLGEPLSEDEIATVTEFLLGLHALDSVPGSDLTTSSMLVDQILDVASVRLHAALRDDAELRRGLAQHLERLSVRLRHGLPVHNPLIDEVSQRYPDVHAVSHEIGSVLEAEFGRPVINDELGFITMYLCGAMERARLRPRRRACVVCPSGMATAWVLVSRIQAEFPELDLVEVLSERSYHELDHRDFDLVISTIRVDEVTCPVVVVGPLLSASDVARVSALL